MFSFNNSPILTRFSRLVNMRDLKITVSVDVRIIVVNAFVFLVI